MISSKTYALILEFPGERLPKINYKINFQLPSSMKVDLPFKQINFYYKNQFPISIKIDFLEDLRFDLQFFFELWEGVRQGTPKSKRRSSMKSSFIEVGS